MSNTYVLDAFAIIGFFKNERGTADIVDDLFRRAEREEVELTAAAVNVGELYYKTMREFGGECAKEVLDQFWDYSVEIVEVDWPLAYAGATLKSVHRLSYADCIAAALAQQLGAKLVTGDPGFGSIPDLDIEWLPVKRRL